MKCCFLEKCAVEHPHHTLPILFSLKKYILNASQAASGRRPRNNVQEPRVAAAEAMVKLVASESDGHAAIVAQMEKLCDGIIIVLI
jgi:hypothetical protein